MQPSRRSSEPRSVGFGPAYFQPMALFQQAPAPPLEFPVHLAVLLGQRRELSFARPHPSLRDPPTTPILHLLQRRFARLYRKLVTRRGDKDDATAHENTPTPSSPVPTVSPASSKTHLAIPEPGSRPPSTSKCSDDDPDTPATIS